MQTPDTTTQASVPRKHQKPGVHSISAPKRRSRRAAGGFTLIELLTFIGIAVLLLGILAGASIKMLGEMRRDQMRSTMVSLLGANDEFNAVRQQGPVNHTNDYPIDWSQESAGNSSAERFVYAMRQIPSAEQIMLSALNSSSESAFERMYRDDTIYDRWETELQYRRSNDGTGSHSGVSNDKLPLSKSPFFVSAGPDEEFGTDDDLTTIENPNYR